MMARGTIFGRGRNGALVALDAKTGKEIWVREGMDGMTQRGINYWESADGSDRRLLFAMNDYLQAIDARTGKLITTFGDNGAVDLREGLGPRPGDDRAHPVADAGTGVREPDPAGLGARRGLHVGARARPRVRRPHRQAGVALQHHSAAGRVRLRHLAARRLQVHRRGQHLGRAVGGRRPRHRLLPDRVAHLRLLRRRSARARTCTAPACWRSMPAPASGSGTSSSCTTTCGTTTPAPRRS